MDVVFSVGETFYHPSKWLLWSQLNAGFFRVYKVAENTKTRWTESTFWERENVKRGARGWGDGEVKLVNKWDGELSQPVSLPLKQFSAKTELVLTAPRINSEHARAGREENNAETASYRQVKGWETFTPCANYDIIVAQK